MPKIQNYDVYGLAKSIYRSGYSFMTIPPDREEFIEQTKNINDDIAHYQFETMLKKNPKKKAADEYLYSNSHIKRAIKLANAKGGGHDQYLTGIKVDMDLTASEKAWVQIQRYKFMDFTSSFSLMHRATSMDVASGCNKYVYGNSIDVVNKLLDRYNSVKDSGDKDTIEQAKLELLYNIPMGFELTAGMTTNYRCLKNMYHQRRNHLLPDWQYICDWIETLPLAGYLITGKDVEAS